MSFPSLTNRDTGSDSIGLVGLALAWLITLIFNFGCLALIVYVIARVVKAVFA